MVNCPTLNLNDFKQMSDQTDSLHSQVSRFVENEQHIQICAGDSKAFYAQQKFGERLDTKNHSGIVNYEPTELVLTARCGTPLSEIENTLAEQNQMLAFEPPHFTEHSTFGGCLAAGLSGPRRPFVGAVRDFTLGMKIINGKAEVLKFGGEVIKNVAGYDLSRLFVGSLGTLGLILDASVKVLPKPETEITLSFELTQRASISRINKLCLTNLPINASCFDGQQLRIRLSGTKIAIDAAKTRLGGELLEQHTAFWQNIKNHQHDFFKTDKRIWRISLSPSAPPLEIAGEQMNEWRGALRWLCSDESPEKIRALVAEHNGHATIFKNAQKDDLVFEPLSGKLHQLNMNIKLAMDPKGLFNQGTMYESF